MEITIFERDDDISHVALTGRLDTTAADEFDERFSDATAGRGQPAIVDLSGIEFMASRGIGMLFASSKKLKQAGYTLVLLNPQGMVDGVLKSSKMDKVMPIAYHLDDALRTLGRDPATVGPSRLPGVVADEGGREDRAAASAAAGADRALKIAIKNELSELDGLNAKLAAFLQAHSVPPRAAYAIDLAIEELVVNVIRYGYIDDETHLIDVQLGIESDQLILQIVDDGRPFDPREGPEFDPFAEDRDVGGLGLILVLDLVDVLRYERVEDKNCVEVRVRLTPEDVVDEASENEADESSDSPDDLPDADGE